MNAISNNTESATMKKKIKIITDEIEHGDVLHGIVEAEIEYNADTEGLNVIAIVHNGETIYGNDKTNADCAAYLDKLTNNAFICSLGFIDDIERGYYE